MRSMAHRWARRTVVALTTVALWSALTLVSTGTAAAGLSTTTTTTMNPPTSQYRELQTFLIEVMPPPDGGIVELKVDGSTVASTTFVENVILLTWVPPANGTYDIQAFYGGTATFSASQSDVIEATFISPPATSVTIEASDDPVIVNDDVTFTATVDPNPGSGEIQWYLGGIPTTTTDVDEGGTSSWTTSFSTIGMKEVKARFTGNELFEARDSQPFMFFVNLIPVTLSLSLPGGPFAPGLVEGEVTIDPIPETGVLTWALCQSCSGTEIAIDPSGTTELSIGPFDSGDYQVFVNYQATGDYSSATDSEWIEVYDASTTDLVADRATAYQGELPVKLTATVASAGPVQTGTVTFFDDVGGVVVQLGPVSINSSTKQAILSSSSLRVGAHSVTAKYNGQGGVLDGILPSTSDPVTFTVKPDTSVHATFASSAAKFYAAKDGYFDTVNLGGTLDEQARVAIKIFNGAGTLKRTWKLGSENPGAYGVTWNGKTASGAKLAAGKYRVKAVIEDTKGHKTTFTATTILSWREVVWKTVTVRKNGNSGTFFVGEFGGAIYLSPYYAKGILLDSGEMIEGCDECGFAAGRYRFNVVTSNVLAYRKTWIEIRGHGFVDREHTGRTYVLDPATDALGEWTWNPEYDISGQTHNLLFGSDYIDENGRIEAWVWMTQAFGDAFDLKYLKLNYQYAVWK